MRRKLNISNGMVSLYTSLTADSVDDFPASAVSKPSLLMDVSSSQCPGSVTLIDSAGSVVDDGRTLDGSGLVVNDGGGVRVFAGSAPTVALSEPGSVDMTLDPGR